jgi:hypothetical protein
MKFKGVRYTVTRTEAALIKAMPEGQDRRDLGSYTTPEGAVYSLYLSQEGNTLPVPCVEGPDGDLNCSLPPRDRVSTGGWGGSNGKISIVFAAPSNGEVIVNTVSGDVVPIEIGRLPELGVAWFVHIGDDMSPFGIESKAPGAKPFLPPFGPEKADKTDPTVIATETTPTAWTMLGLTYGPQKIICVDTGDEKNYSSCMAEIRPGDKRFGRLISKSESGFVVTCKGSVKGFTWSPIDGPKQKLDPSPIDHPRYTFTRIPSKDGVLTFQFAKAQPVDFPMGSVGASGFGVLNDLTRVSNSMPSCAT